MVVLSDILRDMKKAVPAVFLALLVIATFIFLFGRNVMERVLESQPTEKEKRGEASIGYIGCSNTRETVEGYHRMGGEKMWSYDKRYDAGAVLDWAKNAETGNKYWKVFEDLFAENPGTNIIWWQLCIRDNERETQYEHAARVLEAARKRIPGATIYVSALADYTSDVCEITGTWGLVKAKELVRELDANNDDVLPGPVLGPMSPAETAEDGCHLSSPDGKRKLGTQIREFFDRDDSANPAN